MINFSLEKFRSSDASHATETFRVKNSDNVLTKSRKLETKSSWIIKLRSFLNLKKSQRTKARGFQFLLIICIPISLHLCLATMACVHSLSYETHSRSGAPNGRGPWFLEPVEPAIATPLSALPLRAIIISRDFLGLSPRLLREAHTATFSSSRRTVCLLEEPIITYVSSAYLDIRFSGQ